MRTRESASERDRCLGVLPDSELSRGSLLEEHYVFSAARFHSFMLGGSLSQIQEDKITERLT